jgi:hypothetical protein
LNSKINASRTRFFSGFGIRISRRCDRIIDLAGECSCVTPDSCDDLLVSERSSAW